MTVDQIQRTVRTAAKTGDAVPGEELAALVRHMNSLPKGSDERRSINASLSQYAEKRAGRGTRA